MKISCCSETERTDASDGRTNTLHGVVESADIESFLPSLIAVRRRREKHPCRRRRRRVAVRAQLFTVIHVRSFFPSLSPSLSSDSAFSLSDFTFRVRARTKVPGVAARNVELSTLASPSEFNNGGQFSSLSPLRMKWQHNSP